VFARRDRVRLIKSVVVQMGQCLSYLDNCGNSRANICNSYPEGRAPAVCAGRVLLLDQTAEGVLASLGARLTRMMVTLDNL
jgi:hypothetical protein